MDYYATLGLKRGASDSDIKKAYRSMAMKHHPDRGGDEKKFKEISSAYEALCDPEKKRIIDMGGDPNAQPGGFGNAGGFYNQGPFEFHFGGGGQRFEDVFGGFGFGGFGQGQQHRVRRNKSVNINVELNLEDVLSGKDFDAEINIPGGPRRFININIPPGLEHGQQIRYQGMGDDTFKEAPAGDLLVNVYIRPHKLFRREGDALIYDHKIPVWDAILGSSIEVTTLSGRNISVNVPAGTQPDTILSCKGEGLPNSRSRLKGPLLIKIKIDIPKNLSDEQINLIKEFQERNS